jgi:hypothetical protein
MTRIAIVAAFAATAVLAATPAHACLEPEDLPRLEVTAAAAEVIGDDVRIHAIRVLDDDTAAVEIRFGAGLQLTRELWFARTDDGRWTKTGEGYAELVRAPARARWLTAWSRSTRAAGAR